MMASDPFFTAEDAVLGGWEASASQPIFLGTACRATRFNPWRKR